MNSIMTSDEASEESEFLSVLNASLQSFVHKTLKDEQIECIHRTGFVHFFVNRIQDFFQTFSRPFFLFSRLKITVKFFMAREEIIVLIMKTTNKKRKKTVSAV